jgi:hypothetical protein
MEKVFSVISLYYGSESQGAPMYAAILACLAILKIKNPLLYAKLKIKKGSWKGVDSFIEFPRQQMGDGEGNDFYYIGQLIKYCLLSKEEYNRLDAHDDARQLDSWTNYNRDEIIPHICRYMDIGKIN